MKTYAKKEQKEQNINQNAKNKNHFQLSKLNNYSLIDSYIDFYSNKSDKYHVCKVVKGYTNNEKYT